MKPFRRSRDFDGRFALTTLQNPMCELRSREELIEDARRRQAQVLVAAGIVGDADARAAAQAFRELAAPSDAVEPAASSSTVAAVPSDVVEVASPDIAEAAAPDAVEAAAPAPEPAKRRAKKPKSRKTARASRAIVQCRRRTAASLPKRELTPIERHARKCIICKHDQREEIEEDFLQWGHPDSITQTYQLVNYRTIYRHAHATGLMEQRTMNLRFACESVVEHSSAVVPSADALLRAIRMCTRINNRGEWHEPPSHVIVSSGGRINVDNRSVIVQRSPEPSAVEPIAIPASALISNRQ